MLCGSIVVVILYCVGFHIFHLFHAMNFTFASCQILVFQFMLISKVFTNSTNRIYYTTYCSA